jgi:L,D-transpeptidase YbiS
MQTSATRLHISVQDQLLTLKVGEEVVATYPVSTSRLGLGTEEGSLKTPTGRFRIAEKIGDGAAPGTIFRSRIPLAPGDETSPDDDLVLSRIVWLDGVEPHNASTLDRYIYIHGTNHEDEIGQPASHGCIRMKNADVIELFDQLPIDAEIVIEA